MATISGLEERPCDLWTRTIHGLGSERCLQKLPISALVVFSGSPGLEYPSGFLQSLLRSQPPQPSADIGDGSYSGQFTFPTYVSSELGQIFFPLCVCPSVGIIPG